MANLRPLTPQEMKKLTDCVFGNNCKKIDECIFRHCPEVQSDTPQCTKWSSNFACRRLDCKFQHSVVEPKDKNQRVFFLWDIQNCPVPKGSKAFDVVSKVRTMTESRTGRAMETRFDCFCNVSQLSSEVREGLHHANIQLVDVPVSKPQAVDQKILQEFTRISMDYDGTATIVLISGDIDFLPSLLAIKGRKNFSLGLFYSSSTKQEMLASMDWKFAWNEIIPKADKKQSEAKGSEKNNKTPKEKPQNEKKMEKIEKPEKNKPKPDTRKQEQSKPQNNEAKDKKIECRLCQQEFDSMGSLMQHKNAKHPKPNGERTPKSPSKTPKEKPKEQKLKHKCFGCKSSFSTQDSLNQHRDSTSHWKCRKCGQLLPNKLSLDMHLSIHKVDEVSASSDSEEFYSSDSD